MRPTIGRVVIYREHGGPMHIECPAIVTKVHSDTCVNLHVFFDGAPAGYRTSVVQETPGQTFGWSWDWPKREA